MWLYHGTYDMFYRQIKKDGVIKPGINRDSTSLELDNYINGFAKENIRGNCIYLSADINAMEGFDRSFRVSTSKLDLSKLFVADNNSLDKISAYRNTDMADVFAGKYVLSYMGYIDYLKNKKLYEELYYPEFIYFGDIKIRK